MPIYKCETCSGVGMSYNSRAAPPAGENYACTCESGYKLAGDICVPDGANDKTFLDSIKYENVDTGGEIAGSKTIGVSDTLVQLQLKAAHLCRVTKD